MGLEREKALAKALHDILQIAAEPGKPMEALREAQDIAERALNKDEPAKVLKFAKLKDIQKSEKGA